MFELFQLVGIEVRCFNCGFVTVDCFFLIVADDKSFSLLTNWWNWKTSNFLIADTSSMELSYHISRCS